MIKTHEISHGQLGSSGVNQVLRNVVGDGRVSDFLESYEYVWIIVSSVTRAVRPSDSGGESLIGAVTVWGGSGRGRCAPSNLTGADRGRMWIGANVDWGGAR